MTHSCPFVNEGSLVRHKVFGETYRYGIVLSQDVRQEQTRVMWNFCEDFPVSKPGVNYISHVHTQYLDVLSETEET